MAVSRQVQEELRVLHLHLKTGFQAAKDKGLKAHVHSSILPPTRPYLQIVLFPGPSIFKPPQCLSPSSSSASKLWYRSVKWNIPEQFVTFKLHTILNSTMKPPTVTFQHLGCEPFLLSRITRRYTRETIAILVYLMKVIVTARFLVK
jgi:hypothetical protein